jgi:hypothetical protein
LQTSKGVCVGKSNAYESLLVEKQKYFICLGKTACNLIEQCYRNNNNNKNNTIIECNHGGIVACKVNIKTYFFFIFILSHTQL